MRPDKSITGLSTGFLWPLFTAGIVPKSAMQFYGPENGISVFASEAEATIMKDILQAMMYLILILAK